MKNIENVINAIAFVQGLAMFAGVVYVLTPKKKPQLRLARDWFFDLLPATAATAALAVTIVLLVK